MIELSPSSVLRAITNAIPDECRGDITVIGSLAAGYHFFRNKPGMQVRTKDVDFVVSPMVKAVSLGKDIAERLLTTGCTHRVSGTFTKPGTATTPDYDLPAIRLNPPGSTGWFVEILTVPESANVETGVAGDISKLLAGPGLGNRGGLARLAGQLRRPGTGCVGQ